MPTKSAKSTPTKGKGKGLKKKLGPFPTYVWLILGVVLIGGYYLYSRRKNSGTAAAGSQNQQIIPSGVISPSGTGDNGTSGGISSNTGAPTSFPTDYATQTDLATGLGALSNQTAADIAAITFPQPTVNITPPPAQVVVQTTASKTAAKVAAAPKPTAKVTYYTYKKNVPLKAGQTLHFTTGKGYYAA